MSQSLEQVPRHAQAQDLEPESPELPSLSAVRPSFKSVYTTAFPYVWRLLPRLGVQAKDQPDIAQEAFLAISQRLHTYDPAHDVVPWALRIANNEAVRHRRAYPNAREQLNPDELKRAERLAVDRDDPEQHFARRELAQILDRLIQAIEDDIDRLVLVMHDIEGLPMSAIMVALDLPKTTALGRLARARSVLNVEITKLDPHVRDAFITRGAALFPLFSIDFAKLCDVGHGLDDGLDAIQAHLWGHLQKRMAAAGPGSGVAPELPAGRLQVSMGQVVGVGFFVYLTGALTGDALHPILHPPAPVATEITATHDAVAEAPTTTPADSAASVATASPSVLASLSSPPAAASSVRARSGVGPQDEVSLLDRAAQALEAGRADTALKNLRMHAQMYPQSRRSGERKLMLIQALALANRPKEAAELAQRFMQEEATGSALKPVAEAAASTASKPRSSP